MSHTYTVSPRLEFNLDINELVVSSKLWSSMTVMEGSRLTPVLAGFDLFTSARKRRTAGGAHYKSLSHPAVINAMQHRLQNVSLSGNDLGVGLPVGLHECRWHTCFRLCLPGTCGKAGVVAMFLSSANRPLWLCKGWRLCLQGQPPQPQMNPPECLVRPGGRDCHSSFSEPILHSFTCTTSASASCPLVLHQCKDLCSWPCML